MKNLSNTKVKDKYDLKTTSTMTILKSMTNVERESLNYINKRADRYPLSQKRTVIRFLKEFRQEIKKGNIKNEKELWDYYRNNVNRGLFSSSGAILSITGRDALNTGFVKGFEDKSIIPQTYYNLWGNR